MQCQVTRSLEVRCFEPSERREENNSRRRMKWKGILCLNCCCLESANKFLNHMIFCGPLMSSSDRLKSWKENTEAIWETNHCGPGEHLVSVVVSLSCCWEPSCCILPGLGQDERFFHLKWNRAACHKGSSGWWIWVFLASLHSHKVNSWKSWVLTTLMCVSWYSMLMTHLESEDFLNKWNGQRFPWVLLNGGFFLKISCEMECGAFRGPLIRCGRKLSLVFSTDGCGWLWLCWVLLHKLLALLAMIWKQK